jgi:hypothetical protein
MSEPMGRFSAVRTIGRGLEEAPVLRQGLGVTWMLAAVGACGRVVVPILLQQAIDKGIVRDGPVRVGLVSGLAVIAAVSLVVSGIAQRQASGTSTASASPITTKSAAARSSRGSRATSRPWPSSSRGAAWRGCSTDP